MVKSNVFLACLIFLLSASFQTHAQTVLIDYHFTTTTLPAGVTSDGILSPTKAADGACSQGMLQVNSGQYMQVQVSSVGAFRVNMKSTSSSARTVTVKYKKDGDADFTTATTSLSVLACSAFNLTTLYPGMLSSVPVTVRIEPTSGNIQVHDLYVEASTSQSSSAEISEFKLPLQIGTEVINSTNGTIAVNVPQGTALTAVVPQRIIISAGASINPEANTAQDFSGQKQVSYTVTAQNGTTKTWKVTVTEVASSAKEITAFKLTNEQIGDAAINTSTGTIVVTMPLSASLTNLTPLSIALSPYATINPSANTARDFSQPVSYAVTAQDNSTKVWTVTVNRVDPNAVFYNYEAEVADFTGKTDNSHLNYTGSGFVDFLADGENYIIFNTCQIQAGSQTAKFRYSLAKDDIRTGSLYVNDVFIKSLAFARTATFDDWAEEIATVQLNAGLNKIKITWETTDGPNLDKMSLTGTQCASYSLNATSNNAAGVVTISPARADKKYYEGESVKLLALNKPDLVFDNWTGDLTGNASPATIVMNANKTITANFRAVNTYKLNVTVNGIGEVRLSPVGGEYSEGTVVTLSAKSVLGSAFQGWSGNATGTDSIITITMNSVKNVTATFSTPLVLDFNKVVGFASITADGFTGPTTGGSTSKDTVFINGPAEFAKLCQVLQDRIKYKAYSTNPLTIVLEEGTYTGVGGKLSVWANEMLTVQDQGNLTIIGRKNVILKFGINLKRASNIIIRNITFQDYYDDGINIGEPETHHVWVDHCTVGNPIGLPADSEHPDGGIDIKAGSSYVTVSWTKYRNSWKTGLVGHSDSNGGEDNGRLKVTYFCNYFFHTNSRNPRVRFGEVHILNNLEEQVMLYGIAAANGAHVYAENNFFLNTDWPMVADRTSADFKAVYGNNTDDVYTSKTGNYPAVGLKQVGNEYDDSGLPVITAQINPAMLNPGGRSIKFDEFHPELVFNPRSYYDYEAFSASTVRSIIPMFAGADKVDFWAKNNVFPLSIISFNAILNAASNKKIVTVTWTTANEINTESFIVERSADGTNFTVAGKVVSKNTNGTFSYNFTDENPLEGISYYRLKQIDKDGNITYSKVAAVNNKSFIALAVYPNPGSKGITLFHPKASTGATIKIVTAIGQSVLTKTAVAGTLQTTGIDVSGLPAGYYMILFENNGEITSTKFLKN